MGQDHRVVVDVHDPRLGCEPLGDLILRAVEEITSFFDGLHLVGPGVVPVTRWRPEPGSPAPEVVAEHGGLARKP
ncbi:hypothetical protein GCM10010345_75280 [Streptomyces canarius]|uniref:Uncharacterized protein n=1 Tax=Streptomyces canarius TaxID=285453 RepID=A0ABQ3D5L2_9ACTN|nr:hypothetical protein GCM10010345_75280 [Streptomyces canarius]